MYLTPTKNHWILDIETNGLRDEATVIWVVCVENAVTDEALTFTDMKEFVAWVNEDKSRVFVTHNGIAFDIPVCNSLVGTRIGAKRIVDTFVLSMLYSPSLSGGHSLDSWGQRLRCAKGEFNDWSKLSDEMISYCQQDVRVQKLLFNKLSARMKQIGFSELSCELEHLSWHIIQNKQRRRGFPFNRIEAEKLYTHLLQRKEELRKEIYELWPPKFEVVKSFKNARKKDGNYSASYLRHLEQYPELRETDDGGYEALDWVEFNLGSPSQRIEKLLELGWEPTKFTKKTEKGGGGNPQVDEDQLLAYAEECGRSEIKALALWIVTASRANMINNWLSNYNEKTGAIHGNLWLAGSLRYRHDKPNSANIPAVRLDAEDRPVMGEAGGWTYESRDLWYSGGGDYDLVGVDAKGIQLRVLANYLADEAFIKAVLSADPHSANRDAWGFSQDKAGRALAKTILYAIVMGAGDGRIASEAKISLQEAKAAKELFFNRVPGMRSLINKLKRERERTGRITLCDGSRVLVPSDHRVIPFLLQGDESRIMRQAAILLDEQVRKEKLDACKVGDIHDEWQSVVRREHTNRFSELALEAFPAAGKVFSYIIPIEGDVNVGRTWAETH